MRYLITPILLTLLLLWYVVAVGIRAVAMLGSQETILVAFGIAALIIPALTLWFIIKEWRLAWDTEQMRKAMLGNGLAVPDELPRSPGGRIDRSAAQEYVQEFEELAAEDPDAWPALYNLAWAYDAAGSRSQARSTLLKASARYHATMGH